MSHERNLELLNRRRIVYRRLPITDKPTIENECYMFYIDGTYECYELFRSKAKINTYRSLKWHLLVLWYLNPQLDPEGFDDIVDIITDKRHGFITFTLPSQILKQMVYEVSMLDLEEPPKNKIRKVIFKPNSGLCKEEKLRIVGELIGRSKKVYPDDVYECMLSINDDGENITIGRIAGLLGCSTRTIHRNMCHELRKEIKLLNKQNEEI